MITTLRDMLILHEKRVPWYYPDDLGYATIGVGHLIDKRKGGRLPDFIIDALLDYDIDVHKKALLAVQPWVLGLSPVRQAVMYDMTFNLGIEPFDGDGFKDWPTFVNQVRTGQWAAAAANMRSTVWAGQVGTRAVRLANMMERGTWPTG